MHFRSYFNFAHFCIHYSIFYKNIKFQLEYYIYRQTITKTRERIFSALYHYYYLFLKLYVFSNVRKILNDLDSM